MNAASNKLFDRLNIQPSFRFPLLILSLGLIVGTGALVYRYAVDGLVVMPLFYGLVGAAMLGVWTWWQQRPEPTAEG